jgi:hypothetical protein
MNATIVYQPVEGFPVGEATTYEQLENAFGELPLLLNKTHITRLEMLAASWQGLERNPYLVLIDAIALYGGIRVWAEK